jgi:hypothetical protein
MGLQADKGVIEIKHLFGISRLGWPLWRNLANYAHVIVLINMALLAENNSKNRHHVETATKNEKKERAVVVQCDIGVKNPAKEILKGNVFTLYHV